MKVNIYETVEVSDEQRIDIARQIDGNGAKKRSATRDEIKEYIWSRGSAWDVHLLEEVVDDAPDKEADEVSKPDEEDLI